MKTKPFLWTILLVFVGLACNLSGQSTPTPVVLPPPTIAATAESVSPTAMPPATLTTPPEQAMETAVLPSPTTLQPTTEATATTAASLTPSPLPSSIPLPTPTTQPALFAPGQQDTAAFAGKEFRAYRFNGVKFQPLFIFVETPDDLSLSLLVFEGEISADTPLESLPTPVAEADFSEDAGPEIMVFSPQRDGLFSLVVLNMSEVSGNYTVYLYDATTPAANTVQEAASLTAGETKTYAATSNGGRPVLVFADPSDDSNLVIQIVDDDSVITEANFAGGGSAEAAFVLPLQTTTYTVRLSEAEGDAAAYNVVIVTLE